MSKLQEFFDSSKAVMFIPLLITFGQLILESAKVFSGHYAKSIRESQVFPILENLFENAYKICFIAIFGIMVFGFFASGAILFYLLTTFYVVFYSLPLIHKNDAFKMRIMEFVMFLFFGVLFLIFVLDVSFN